jgi:hypothetical protein
MKYYILIYYSATKYPDLWDSVARDANFYPNEFSGNTTSKNGQVTPNWGKVVPYLICKDSEPTQAMTDAVNEEADAWNLANPDNQTGTMQLVFEESEQHLIADQLLERQTELIEAGVIG